MLLEDTILERAQITQGAGTERHSHAKQSAHSSSQPALRRAKKQPQVLQHLHPQLTRLALASILWTEDYQAGSTPSSSGKQCKALHVARCKLQSCQVSCSFSSYRIHFALLKYICFLSASTGLLVALNERAKHDQTLLLNLLWCNGSRPATAHTLAPTR